MWLLCNMTSMICVPSEMAALWLLYQFVCLSCDVMHCGFFEISLFYQWLPYYVPSVPSRFSACSLYNLNSLLYGFFSILLRCHVASVQFSFSTMWFLYHMASLSCGFSIMLLLCHVASRSCGFSTFCHVSS